MISRNYLNLIKSIIREQLASLNNPLDAKDDGNSVKNPKNDAEVSDKISDIEKTEKEDLETIQADLEMKKKERSMKTSNNPSVNAERDKRLKMDIDLLTKRMDSTKKNMDTLKSLKNDSNGL